MISDRRQFLGGLATLGFGFAAPGDARAADLGAQVRDRQEQAVQVRLNCAQQLAKAQFASSADNGDEAQFPGGVLSFAKGLAHMQNGEPNPGAYATLLTALRSGKADDFSRIQRGAGRRLVNPRAGLAFNLEGADARQFSVAPAPTFSSAESAAEMVELYWQALARDVPFADYESSPVIQVAVADLDNLSALRGPAPSDGVTAANIFRGGLPGDLNGPYLSQFLWRPVPLGSNLLEQRNRSPIPGQNFLTAWSEWLQMQGGVPPWLQTSFDATPRYIRTGRELAEWVHFDFLHQAFLNAGLMLVDMGPDKLLNMNEYWAKSNPYRTSRVEDGFVTFGMAQVVDWVARVTTTALKATWAEKWFVHRRLRPEAFGGRLHQARTANASYPIHADLLHSAVLDQVQNQTGTYLLPQVYPEGAPLHPAYPAGHATVSGACVTVLKALFDENQPIPDCVTPSADGLTLIPRSDLTLTVGEELNKLASNIAMGRNFAGIHYRSDYMAGVRLGEQIAITMLTDLAATMPEDFGAFEFTDMTGNHVMITKP